MISSSNASAHPGPQIPGPARTLRLWPWFTSIAAALLVNLIIGAGREWNFRGISGFSTTNFGWLAFATLGGLVLAWRMADGRILPLGWIRPLIASATAFTLCFITVTAMGLIFLSEQSVLETVTTDAPGRSLPVGLVVLTAGYLMETGRALVRALSPATGSPASRPRRRARHTDSPSQWPDGR